MHRGEANDATGLDVDVERWLNATLWPALEKTLTARETAPGRASDSKAADAKELLVLYGSQTGNSMEIAKNIAAEAPSHGVGASVKSLEEVKLASLVGSGAVVLVVISSTGDGDAPDNAARFVTQLKKKANAADMLAGIKFSVLGMGDQNYSAFMAVPRTVNRRFLECGAEVFYPRGEVDEVEGIEQQVDEWLSKFWDAAKKALIVDTTSPNTTAEDACVDTKSVAGHGHEPPPPAAAAAVAAAAAAPAASVGPPEEVMRKWGVPPLPTCDMNLVLSDDHVPKGGDNEETDTKDEVDEDTGAYDASRPFLSRIVDARVMTSLTSDRRVIHLDVSTEGSGIVYAPGDSIGVLPENDPELISAFLERIDASGNRDSTINVYEKENDKVAAEGEQPEALAKKRLFVHIKCPCSLHDAFLKYIDITSAPRKSLLRMLAEHSHDATERSDLLYLSSREGRAKYKSEILEAELSVFELLQRFPSCKPPLSVLIALLPPLMPRMYSVCSSQHENPRSVQVAFSVVNVRMADGRVHRGVATNWLDGLCRPIMDSDGVASRSPDASTVAVVPIFPRGGGSFRLPDDDSLPIIMIGPGTGVAPFRGFLQERRCRHASGSSWLFFGCRAKDEDYIYKTDFEAFVEDGTLSRLDVAFSREGASKVYVQHKMRQEADAVRDWIVRRGASVFVCGDGAHMAKDVHAALIEILSTAAPDAAADDNGHEVKEEKTQNREAAHAMSAEDATAFLKQMQAEKRYVRDIWS